MPITIDYSQFTTQTGNFPITPSQPYQYSGIYNGVSNLAKNDGIITFTNLPNGLRVASPESVTAPFDSVYIDLEQINDYILADNSGDGMWYGSDTGEELYASYTSGGFWAIRVRTPDGEGGWASDNIICTGSGNANTSIAQVQFESASAILETSFDPTQDLITLTRYSKNIFVEGGSSQFPNIVFNQLENYHWTTEVIRSNILNWGNLYVSGTSYSGNNSSVTLGPTFSGIISWSGNSLTALDGYQLTGPAPFSGSTFQDGYSWNATYPNEIMSSYNIISDNLGNSGTASIQLTNVETFSDLIPPLRKLHVLFRRA